jgi:hypothetical protein
MISGFVRVNTPPPERGAYESVPRSDPSFDDQVSTVPAIIRMNRTANAVRMTAATAMRKTMVFGEWNRFRPV